MSTVNPNIPLSVDTSPIDIGKMLSLGELSQKMRANQQSFQAQNALKQLFSQPGSLDANGNPTPQTIQKTLAIDPKAGLELRETTLDAQVKQMQERHYQTEMGKSQFDFMTGAAAAGVKSYQDAIKAGKTPQDAMAAAAKARNDTIRANGGILDESQVDRITSAPFQLDQATAMANQNPDYVATLEKDRTLDRQDKQFQETQRRDDDRFKQEGIRDAALFRSLADKENNVNPKTRAYDEFMKENPNATAEQQAKFIQSQNAPRSAAGMELQKFMSENPNATDEELRNHINSLKFDQTGAAAAGRRQGNLAGVEAVLPGLIDNAIEASSKVPRGTFVPLNKLEQMGDSAISDPDMLQFKIANQGVSSELQQLIARGGSNVTALKEAMELMNTAQSQKAYAAGMEQVKKELKKVKEGSDKVGDDYAGKNNSGSGSVHPSKMSDDDLKKALGF